MRWVCVVISAAVAIAAAAAAAAGGGAAAAASGRGVGRGHDGVGGSPHTDTFAVVLCASRFWFNYRHVAGALSVYRALRARGLDDDHIVLMLAEDIACNARNGRPGEVFGAPLPGAPDLHCGDAAVDYRDAEVTADAVLRVLSGRHLPGTPARQRLGSSAGSNVLVYMAGHGGDGFLKIQDANELAAEDIGAAIADMLAMGRAREVCGVCAWEEGGSVMLRDQSRVSETRMHTCIHTRARARRLSQLLTRARRGRSAQRCRRARRSWRRRAWARTRARRRHGGHTCLHTGFTCHAPTWCCVRDACPRGTQVLARRVDGAGRDAQRQVHGGDG